MELYNLYKNIILESVTRNNVIDAIENRYRVTIFYAGDDNTASGKRTIEVYVYGTTFAGNPAIRAYQLFGDSKTRVVPGWKIFRLDRILDWRPTKGSIFYNPINERDPNAPAFNPYGDRGLRSVYKIIKFR